LGIPFFFAASLVAKSGIYDVPFLTDRLYRFEPPIREVMPLVGRDAATIWKEAAAGGRFSANTGNVILNLNESELTTIVSESIFGTEGLPFRVEKPQVAVLGEGLQFHFVVPRGEREVSVVAVLAPKIDDGGIRFDVGNIKVGAAELPDLVSGAAERLVNQVIGRSFGESLSDGISLRKVETTADGRLQLTINLK
jgi:hypothetical protein